MTYDFKSKFDVIYENFMAKSQVVNEDNSALITATLDKVVIDPKELKRRKEDIEKAKGPSFYKQLEIISNEGKVLTVTSIKRVNRTSGNMVDAVSHNFQEEADVVQELNPGSYHSPMSLPLNILKKVADYNGSFNSPLADKNQYKAKQGVGVQDDSYNTGKQPKGTINNGGNN